MPPTTRGARVRVQGGSFGVGPWEKIQDFSLYDRCITRGAIGSFMPAVYGNGARIIQTPNAVVITYEMIHDTRIILSGQAVARFEHPAVDGRRPRPLGGDTLVVESANFTDRTAVGGAAHSTATADRALYAHRSGDDRLRDHRQRSADLYQAVDDAADDHAAAGLRDLRDACHEGNHSMRNVLLAERAWEKEAADAKAKGLPPPPRVFEQVNGPDRAR